MLSVARIRSDWWCIFVELASPLRLNTDATVFLSLAQSFLEGDGFVFEGRITHFPVGYPLIVATLDRIGIASSATFISVNILSVGAGLLALRYLLPVLLRVLVRDGPYAFAHDDA